eukprot:scaffold1622_cov114-Skeletonema_menzelii.AAC.3
MQHIFDSPADGTMATYCGITAYSEIIYSAAPGRRAATWHWPQEKQGSLKKKNDGKTMDKKTLDISNPQASSKLELYRKSEGPQSRIFVTYFGPCRREGACPAAA